MYLKNIVYKKKLKHKQCNSIIIITIIKHIHLLCYYTYCLQTNNIV